MKISKNILIKILSVFFLIVVVVVFIAMHNIRLKTEYSIGYNEKLFTDIKKGDSINNIIDKLGQPFSIFESTNRHLIDKISNNGGISYVKVYSFSKPKGTSFVFDGNFKIRWVICDDNDKVLGKYTENYYD